MEGFRITMENLKQGIRCYVPNSNLVLPENKFRAFTDTREFSLCKNYGEHFLRLELVDDDTMTVPQLHPTFKLMII
jgi:hypothetical protein